VAIANVGADKVMFPVIMIVCAPAAIPIELKKATKAASSIWQEGIVIPLVNPVSIKDCNELQLDNAVAVLVTPVQSEILIPFNNLHP